MAADRCRRRKPSSAARPGPTARLAPDHGYGSAAFIAGGAVNGGKIVADWPGMSQQALFEGRDLDGDDGYAGAAEGRVGRPSA